MIIRIIQTITLIIIVLSTPATATETVEEQDGVDVTITEPILPENTVEPKAAEPSDDQVFRMLGRDIPRGTRQTLEWVSDQSPGGFAVPASVLVVNGSKPGPVLCITAAIHGDELNGIEIARQIIHGLDPLSLSGTVVAVPVVNLDGFWRRDRYVGDRRDLNRFFPGSPQGSYAARIAYSLFNEIIIKCDVLVDLHTGSFFRENLPQLRADLTIEAVSELVKKFGAITALQSISPSGSLRGAATASGIPAVVMEIGGPLSLEPEKVEHGVNSLKTLLSSMEMIDTVRFWSSPQPVFYESAWVRADAGGILMNSVGLGEKISTGDLLAEIIDPVSNTMTRVITPYDGIILGRAQNQFVSPGFALFHIGMRRTMQELEKQGVEEKKAVVEKQAVELGLKPEPDPGDSSSVEPQKNSDPPEPELIPSK